MYSFKTIIPKNIIILFFLIKIIFCEQIFDLKKLSSFDSYFVVLDSGLYLYNPNLLDCAIIHNFNPNIKSSDKVILSQINNEEKSYIICLVNELVFIFNEYTNKTNIYELDDYNNINQNYYEVLPYNIENDNISFFMVLNKEKEKLTFNFYTLNLNENNINGPIVKEFDNMNIQSKRIRCIIINNLSIIKCFYYSKNNNNKHLLASTNFSINNNISIIMEDSFNMTVNKEIKQIKSAIS